MGTRLESIVCASGIVNTRSSGKCYVTFIVQGQANQIIFASEVVDVNVLCHRNVIMQDHF